MVCCIQRRFATAHYGGRKLRPLNVSLCDTTWKLAKRKTNFSAWVRDQLRSERNQQEAWKLDSKWWKCNKCEKISQWANGAKYIFCRNKHCNGDQQHMTVVDDLSEGDVDV